MAEKNKKKFKMRKQWLLTLAWCPIKIVARLIVIRQKVPRAIFVLVYKARLKGIKGALRY